MKKFFFIATLFCSIQIFAQTAEVYSYISNYVVNTGTGEKKQWHTELHFYCRFNSDKSICYQTNENGKLYSEIYPGDETKPCKQGHGTYKKNKCEEYHYEGNRNGVLVYKKHCTYYAYSSLDTDARGFYTGGQSFSNPKEYTEYIYFSPDYSKMNMPRLTSDVDVFTYDRIFPDKKGTPTQIW